MPSTAPTMPETIEYSFSKQHACNMCGAGEAQFETLGIRLNQSQGFRPKTRTGIAVGVRRCRTCRLVFADPQPVPANFDAHYGEPDEYWSEDYQIDDPSYFRTEIAEAVSLLGNARGLRALDIGAGIGKAMQALAKQGFDCFGIEPSRSFRDLALGRGIASDKLLLAGIEDASFAAESFDYITFGAVLEHLFSPADALARAIEWLKPGGIIQAEVPSSRYLMSKITNAYFRMRGTNYVTNISPMHPPFHLYEFDLASFEMHGRRAGYEIASHRYGVGGILNLPSLVHPLLRGLMKMSDTGMQLTVHLRKIESVPARAPQAAHHA